MDAVSIASQVCNYRHPKLATVKVGGDRENPLLVREGVTSSLKTVSKLSFKSAINLLAARAFWSAGSTPHEAN